MSVGLWAIYTKDDNRTTAGQSHAALQSFPIHVFLIINIILTYFNDALNSSGVKQCAFSVPGYEYSVANKNNLTTPETNPYFQGWADDTSGPNYITWILLHLHHKKFLRRILS